jgi:hypothetical protein
MMQVYISHTGAPGGFIEPAANNAGRTEDLETSENSKTGVRTRTTTAERLPVASMRLVVLPVGFCEKGPGLRPHLGIGFSEWLVEWCGAIDLRAARETESEV